MKVAEIVRADGAQLVKLPEGFQLEGDIVSIRRQGKAIVLEPVKPATWPPGFFEQIHIDDPAFARPPRGKCHRLQDWIELPPLLHERAQSFRSSGEPSAISRPWSTSTTRSQYSASSWKWVVTITVTPCSTMALRPSNSLIRRFCPAYSAPM